MILAIPVGVARLARPLENDGGGVCGCREVAGFLNLAAPLMSTGRLRSMLLKGEIPCVGEDARRVSSPTAYIGTTKLIPEVTMRPERSPVGLDGATKQRVLSIGRYGPNGL
jgi:hypothetical protein